MASEYVWFVAAKLCELLQSDRFDCESLKQRELSLSQAFCLLWQNQQTSDVVGRQKAGPLSDTATAAVLLDLYALGKIDLKVEIKQWMEKRREIVLVEVKDDTLTNSYLDQALFSKIVKHHLRTAARQRTAAEWIVQGSCDKDNSATKILDSLVNLGILGKESRLFGRRYPTVNSDPERKLVDEIRRVVLLDEQADGFIWTLLKLMHEADSCFGHKSILIQQYFSATEIAIAREKIGNMTAVSPEKRNHTQENSDSFELQVV